MLWYNINLDVCRWIINLKNTKYPHSIATGGTSHLAAANYNQLLPVNSGASIHQRHLKSINILNPQFVWDYFFMNRFLNDLRKLNTLGLPLVHSTRHGTNLILFRCSLPWSNLTREIKETSTEKFKIILKEKKEQRSHVVSSSDVIYVNYCNSIASRYP